VFRGKFPGVEIWVGKFNCITPNYNIQQLTLIGKVLYFLINSSDNVVSGKERFNQNIGTI
jgi:hypothetical protein